MTKIIHAFIFTTTYRSIEFPSKNCPIDSTEKLETWIVSFNARDEKYFVSFPQCRVIDDIVISHIDQNRNVETSRVFERMRHPFNATFVVEWSKSSSWSKRVFERDSKNPRRDEKYFVSFPPLSTSSWSARVETCPCFDDWLRSWRVVSNFSACFHWEETLCVRERRKGLGRYTGI